MDKFESPIVLYLNDRLSLVETCAAIRDWAEGKPAEELDAASAYLEGLYDSHQIGEHVQKKLLQAVHYYTELDVEFSDDDETVFKPPVDVSEDETVIATAPAVDEDDDATMLAPGIGDDDATRIASPEDDDATRIAGTEDEDATVMASAEESEATKIASLPGEATRMINEINAELDAKEAQVSEDELGPGSILKERFNLVSVLGEGGMGRVYKAIDMLKVEAKDQNPYVAIKLLTGDFKEHPDAFIALQRETSKAQKLAHPNISTVFDFDRHKETVYMTMELLEGVPMDEYIKGMPEGGLEVDHALSIVHDLGAGLAYAHHQGLVHSDFKPGNAFLLDDGNVKVIDFGIARAASVGSDADGPTGPTSAATPAYATEYGNTNTGSSTSTNTSTMTDDVFDAGTLGALTPSYATIEMFEGMAPHPSDDIYALACVAVQLLTGKHPFNKKPAPKAKKRGMKVPVIDGLTKRQQRAIERGLAFDRKDRFETMDDFLDEIRKRKSYVKQIAFGTAAALALITAIGYKPVTNYYEQQELEQIIAAANSGSETYLRTTLNSIDKHRPEHRDTITFGIRDRAIKMYAADIRREVDVDNEVYGFGEANKLIAEALSHYPDSAVIKDLNNTLTQERADHIVFLEDTFTDQLLAKNFFPVEDQLDMVDVMRRLRTLDPDNISFEDPRLEDGYYLGGIDSLNGREYDVALTWFSLGREYLPDSRLFQNMIDSVRITRLNEVLASRIESARLPNSQQTLEQYSSQTEALMVNSLMRGRADPGYAAFLDQFDEAFGELQTSLGDVAQQQLMNFSSLLPYDRIVSYSEAIGIEPATDQKLKALPDLDFLTADTTIDTLTDQVRKIRLAIRDRQTAALTQYNLDYTAVIEPLAEQQRHALIAFYNELYADLFIDETRKSNASIEGLAKTSYEETLANTTLMSRVEKQKLIFRKYALQNRLDNSIEVYNRISGNTDDDEFIDFAKIEISRMMINLAQSSHVEGEYERALNYILRARAYVDDEENAELEKEYRKEVLVASIPDLVVTHIDEEEKPVKDENATEARKILASLKKDYPEEYPILLSNIAPDVNVHIVKLAGEDLLAAHRLKDHALTIVNHSKIRKVNIDPLPEPSKLALQGKIEVEQHNLSAASVTLKAAREETPEHYQVDELEELLNTEIELAETQYKAYIEHYAGERYRDADESLNTALQTWKDSERFLKERGYYDRVMMQVEANAKLCREDILGIGKQTRGVCNDKLLSAKADAPTLVVVPAVSTKDSPYAIGKYEVSTAEINRYCSVSGNCTPMEVDNDALPAVNVPLDTINAYVGWLSEETGFQYSVASKDEWVNAASAGGREGNTNYNCRLRLGTKLIKGQNIVPIQSGTANNWGLINYVGNADELVRTEDGFEMVGGNFTDSISDCKVTLTKQVDDDSDYAGFRLVRSLF